MKTLQQADWNIIERFLKNIADQNDMLALNQLLKKYPQLKQALQKDKDLEESSEPHFDADTAFMKLHGRFKNENLL
jgi:hypothetical protein